MLLQKGLFKKKKNLSSPENILKNYRITQSHLNNFALQSSLFIYQ